MDNKRFTAGQKLIEAAREFFYACREEGQDGAVQWVMSTDSELVLFTRGEYVDALMDNIWTLSQQRKVHLFGERMAEVQCEESTMGGADGER